MRTHIENLHANVAVCLDRRARAAMYAVVPNPAADRSVVKFLGRDPSFRRQLSWQGAAWLQTRRLNAGIGSYFMSVKRRGFGRSTECRLGHSSRRTVRSPSMWSRRSREAWAHRAGHSDRAQRDKSELLYQARTPGRAAFAKHNSREKPLPAVEAFIAREGSYSTRNRHHCARDARPRRACVDGERHEHRPAIARLRARGPRRHRLNLHPRPNQSLPHRDP